MFINDLTSQTNGPKGCSAHIVNDLIVQDMRQLSTTIASQKVDSSKNQKRNTTLEWKEIELTTIRIINFTLHYMFQYSDILHVFFHEFPHEQQVNRSV